MLHIFRENFVVGQMGHGLPKNVVRWAIMQLDQLIAVYDHKHHRLNWLQSFFCCCIASVEQATDGAKTAGLVSS